mmetsp:Transcript_79911/g.178801  ORF Transcript_79911/g.178801 Transcript_79911/m.178801 type:complete len:305 (-) Transcript_79911:513-1427(-)
MAGPAPKLGPLVLLSDPASAAFDGSGNAGTAGFEITPGLAGLGASGAALGTAPGLSSAEAFLSTDLATPNALLSMGDSPFSESSLTISLTRSCAAFVPSTMRVRLPPTAFEVSLSWSATAARSMDLRCASIFCVTGPSGTLMRICSEGPSSPRFLPLVSSDRTKPSVSATHSPVWMRVSTRCWPFVTARSLPKSFRLTPLSTGVHPLAVRKSSKCFLTRSASSAVASMTSVNEGFTSFDLSAKASSSAPRPTRFSLPWVARSTPSTTCSELSMPSAMRVLSCSAASAISSGVMRTSSRRSSLFG